MRILLVEPGRVPRPAEIGDSLEDMQTVVGGHIQAVYPFEEPVALVATRRGNAWACHSTGHFGWIAERSTM